MVGNCFAYNSFCLMMLSDQKIIKTFVGIKIIIKCNSCFLYVWKVYFLLEYFDRDLNIKMKQTRYRLCQDRAGCRQLKNFHCHHRKKIQAAGGYFLRQGYFSYFQNHILCLYLQFSFHLVLYCLCSQCLKCHLLLLIKHLARSRQVQVLVVWEVHSVYCLFGFF